MEYTGISYFPINANFFEEEVIELLEAKFGMQASYIVMRLLCKIYKEGYYISWGKEQCAIFLRKIGGEVKEETMNLMVDVLLKKGFFSQECFEKHGILTSINIQKVWLEATSRRKKEFDQLPYLLVEPTENKRKKCKQEKEVDKKKVDNLSLQHELNPENEDIFRQSKVKKSKVEKSKESSSIEEEMSKRGTNEEIFEIPTYAYSKVTHNLSGLMENLKRHKVTDPKELQAILRLSDFGRKETHIWKIFANTNWSKIETPGKFMIAALRSQ